MRILLDEDVPLQLLEPLRHLLVSHDVDHVDGLRWKGKKDRSLLLDAAQRGYEAFVAWTASLWRWQLSSARCDRSWLNSKMPTANG